MSKESMKLALEALSPWAGEDANHTEQYAAYQALREALAEQPAQPSKPWVGLTDEDIRQCSKNVADQGPEDCVDRFAYAIEAKLKEKNA